jgi:hypothetical protein
MMFHSDHSSRKMFNSICKGIVFQHLSLSQLPYAKWLASHRRVDGIEDGQPTDICYSTYRDRITQSRSSRTNGLGARASAQEGLETLVDQVDMRW